MYCQMIYTSDVYLYSDKLPVTLKTKHCVIQLLFPYSFNHVKSEKGCTVLQEVQDDPHFCCNTVTLIYSTISDLVFETTSYVKGKFTTNLTSSPGHPHC